MRRPVGDVRHRVAGRVGPAQRAELLVVQVDAGAVGLEQPGRLVDDLLEHLGGVEDGGHARRDLAQRPLGVGAPGDLLARPLELLDQPRVGDARWRAWSASARMRSASPSSKASALDGVDLDAPRADLVAA